MASRNLDHIMIDIYDAVKRIEEHLQSIENRLERMENRLDRVESQTRRGI